MNDQVTPTSTFTQNDTSTQDAAQGAAASSGPASISSPVYRAPPARTVPAPVISGIYRGRYNSFEHSIRYGLNRLGAYGASIPADVQDRFEAELFGIVQRYVEAPELGARLLSFSRCSGAGSLRGQAEARRYFENLTRVRDPHILAVLKFTPASELVRYLPTYRFPGGTVCVWSGHFRELLNQLAGYPASQSWK